VESWPRFPVSGNVVPAGNRFRPVNGSGGGFGVYGRAPIHKNRSRLDQVHS
jgi:hypothetical protein